MKRALLIFLFVLFLPMAVAVSVDVSPKSPAVGGIVTLTAQDCSNGVMSFIRVKNTEGETIDVFQGPINGGSFVASYNTNTDPTVGTFTVKATCAGVAGEGSNTFCVGTNECVVAAGGSSSSSSSSSGGSSSSSSSGGGGGYCTPKWSCNDWTYCNIDLKQTRKCVDTKGCKDPKTETQDCPACEESWGCGGWGQCNGGTQTRVCNDQHACGTQAFKPSIQQTCSGSSGGSSDGSGYDSTQQGQQQFGGNEDYQGNAPKKSFLQKPVAGVKSFWDSYSMWVYIIVGSLVLITIIIVVVMHFVKPKSVAYNHGELSDWIKKEKAMGTSTEDIKHILSGQTGWTHEEIEQAFADVGGSSGDKAAVAQPVQQQPPIQPPAQDPTQPQPPQQ